MTVHLSRDYNTQYTGANRTFISAYVISLFLRRVLGYSYVGDTNFPINPVGTLLLATGDTTPTGSPTWVTANMASLNKTINGVEVYVPTGLHEVGGTDIGRILVLKSTLNPTYNSGVFHITNIDATNNAFIIDWRSNDTPPSETQTLSWYLYAADSNTPVAGASNGGSGYEGNGTSTTPRIILQSPHATAWQVRICIESTAQASNYSIPLISVAPGFGGNSAGDFPTFGRHLHGYLWWNQPPVALASSAYVGLVAGTGDSQGATGSWVYRHYMIGDDTGQAVGWVAYSSAGVAFNIHFGICDNEPTPLPLDPMLRLFILGSGANAGSGTGGNLNGLHFSANTPSSSNSINGGVAFAFAGQPITATPSCWTFVSNEEGTVQNAGPFLNAGMDPGDSPWTSSTDLLSVEVVAGALSAWQTETNQAFYLEPRTMGTIPFFRQGRSNFGNFETTIDLAWLHTLNSVFMIYGGPNNEA